MTGPRSRLSPVLAAAALAVTAGGCAVPAAEALPEASADGVASDVSLPLGAARWQATWDLAGATPGRVGFTTTTDLGYEVTVTSGWLVNYATTLVPCDDAAVAAAGDRLLGLLGVGVAHAHHAEFDDPSMLEMVLVEELGGEAGGAPPLLLGSSWFPTAEYCGAHWLIARGDEDTFDPDGGSAWGRALHVEGRWERGDEAGSIAIGTSLGNAMTRAFDDVDLAAAAGGDGAIVTIERKLGTMFDGVDFAAGQVNAIDWAVVTNLVEQASVSVERVDVVGAGTKNVPAGW